MECETLSVGIFLPDSTTVDARRRQFCQTDGMFKWPGGLKIGSAAACSSGNVGSNPTVGGDMDVCLL
jgi:hypothetical protein